ncbi:DUF6508 domain-containing protein [Pseudomonas coleopterorum]|uniref:DUF6508 domain-containing protein n=1 Tax=Pseudomonas coleopterorum TaxID=1605838 RepID=UPI000F06FCEF|nr:DUF6508 domain-containing protein [Pseudomonas coleopterorum]MBD8481056.1 hypothetical protein [Pseudomonas coleopterorum]MDY1016938.1 DUF6508 domain-containing protein [Pseudomonas coleopterorum]
MFTLPSPSPASVDEILTAWPDTPALGTLTLDSDTVFFAIGRFIDAVYSSGFFFPMDWQRAFTIEQLNDASELQVADAGTLRALLVAHVRVDRFCRGHLLRLFDEGYFETAFERLVELRKAM